MNMTIDQQVALDEALVPHASRLRIVKSIFRLGSDITSKESTLQVVYDVLKLTPFYKAFLVTSDVLEIYMEILHICPRIPNQPFDELPFEEEILAFLRNLGHSGEIKKITDGMYHKKNVDFAYLMWEDFMHQVEHEDSKKNNEMYYPRFTKVIVNFVMTKDPCIPMRNKVGAILSVELTNEAIRNSAAYKEYYAIASGAEPPKTKVSVRKTQSSSDTTMPPPVAKGTRLQTLAKVDTPAKGKQLSKYLQPKKSSDKDDDDDVQQSKHDEDIDDQSDDESYDDQEDDDDQDDEDDDQTDSDNDGNDDASHSMNVGGDEGPDAEDDDNELYRDLNINLEGRDVQMTDVHTTQVLKDTHVTLTSVNPDGIESLFESTPRLDVPVTTTVKPLLLTAPTLPPPSIPIILHVQQAPAPSPATAPSTSLHDLLNFGSLFRFDHRLKTLEANFSEFMQTNQFAEAVSSIPTQAENEDFLHKLDENIQKIIKEQVKEQVKVQVSKILPKIKKTVIEQLEAEVLTRTSNSSKTSYVVAVDLSELELKKILIENMESNKDKVSLKRRRDDEDKDEEPFARSNRGPREDESKSYQKTISESAPAEEPMHITQDLEESTHQVFETGNLLEMSTPNVELSLSLNFKSLKGITTSIWIGSLCVETMTSSINSRRTLCFQRLFKNVHEKHRHPMAYERSSIWCQKLPKEAQPHKQGYNKDKQNRLMCIDELHKFSDGKLNDVRTALDDLLKGIRMKYLPQTI
uniref:Uncharacterized protein n=1 Tax=Tanacetum cinerariifolium TaxID=118510 RepID=A0A699GQX6_TANCI|nr:hypothetical protein [Tanacetum cinerariifolium]